MARWIRSPETYQAAKPPVIKLHCNFISGASGETRTPILFPELDPKSSASTSSATLAGMKGSVSGPAGTGVSGESVASANSGSKTTIKRCKIVLSLQGVKLFPRKTSNNPGNVQISVQFFSPPPPEVPSSCAADESVLGVFTVGAWRSLVARLLWEQEAGGSNPLAPTRFRPKRFDRFPGFSKSLPVMPLADPPGSEIASTRNTIAERFFQKGGFRRYPLPFWSESRQDHGGFCISGRRQPQESRRLILMHASQGRSHAS